MRTDRRSFLGALLAAPLLSRFLPGLAAYQRSQEAARAAYSGAFEAALRRYQAGYAVERMAWAPQLEAESQIALARIRAAASIFEVKA